MLSDLLKKFRTPAIVYLPYEVAIEHDWNGDRSFEHRQTVRAWCEELCPGKWQDQMDILGGRYILRFVEVADAVMAKMRWNDGSASGWSGENR